MDWRAISRSRSRMSVDIDWRAADERSRERGPAFDPGCASAPLPSHPGPGVGSGSGSHGQSPTISRVSHLGFTFDIPRYRPERRSFRSLGYRNG